MVATHVILDEVSCVVIVVTNIHAHAHIHVCAHLHTLTHAYTRTHDSFLLLLFFCSAAEDDVARSQASVVLAGRVVRLDDG